MALQKIDIPLEERLSELDGNVTEKLRAAISSRGILKVNYIAPDGTPISGPYTKKNLCEAIVNYFRTHKIPFGEGNTVSEGYINAYNTLYDSDANKEPLKAIERGMRIDGIPADLIKSLEDDYEKLYFFAGLGAQERPPSHIGSMTSYEIASHYIASGIAEMERRHNSKVKKFLTGMENKPRREIVYAHPWSAPEKVKIMRWTAEGLKGYERVSRRYSRYKDRLDILFEEKAKSATASDGRAPELFAAQCRTVDAIDNDIDYLLGGLSVEAIRYIQPFFPEAVLGDFKRMYPLPKHKIL